MYSNEYVQELEAVDLLDEWFVSRANCHSVEETRRNGRTVERLRRIGGNREEF